MNLVPLHSQGVATTYRFLSIPMELYILLDDIFGSVFQNHVRATMGH